MPSMLFFSVMAELMLKRVLDINAGHTAPLATVNTSVGGNLASNHSRPSASRFLMGSIARKATNRLRLLSENEPQWGVFYRWTDQPAFQDNRENRDIRVSNYIRLLDDGQRYYADPMVHVHDNLHYLFVEEFPNATEKGVISVCTVSPDGDVDTPRVVLECPYHLSYPFVFAHEGEIWMIPETSENQTIELYRAERFPDKWVLEKTLIQNILAHDPTLYIEGDRLWLFVATSRWLSTGHDTLSLFHASTLTGPWTAHPANPVIVDMHTARPAGPIFTVDDTMWRPAQDCSNGYGSALTMCRIDRLNNKGFNQTMVDVIRPDRQHGFQGLHSYGYVDGLEVVDMLGPNNINHKLRSEYTRQSGSR